MAKVEFIDHLHFIVPFSAERQDLRIGETMRALKQLAEKWNVLIILIAHLKKTRVDRAPDLEDLRDSSFIAQESDTVILLWRESIRTGREVVITNNVTVSVQANRRTGKTGNVKMVFLRRKIL
jgi:replicative DNA helicase